MPWLPELFTAPALARIWEDERRRELALVPFFAGVMAGETGALVASFAGVPELHHPVRGRIKGAAAFERFAAETRAWLAERGARPEDVDFVITPGRGVEELVLHLDGGAALPVAIASDHDEQGRIVEQRMYFSTGAVRPPLLQADPDLRVPDVVAEHLRALAAGGMELAPCAVTDDGRACALEYDRAVRGAPHAGLAVYVRDDAGRLAATRSYDAVDPAR